MKIFVAFYPIDWWVIGCMRWFSKAKHDHCSFAFLEEGYDEAYILHVSKTMSPPRFVRESVLHKVYTPSNVIYLGDTDKTPKDMEKIVKQRGRFPLYRIILWFFVTRWFSSWKPKDGCCVLCCDLLKECGKPVGRYVRPTELYKELSNADNYTEWASGLR